MSKYETVSFGVDDRQQVKKIRKVEVSKRARSDRGK
jgi:hypothetical protein